MTSMLVMLVIDFGPFMTRPQDDRRDDDRSFDVGCARGSGLLRWSGYHGHSPAERGGC